MITTVNDCIIHAAFAQNGSTALTYTGGHADSALLRQLLEADADVDMNATVTSISYNVIDIRIHIYFSRSISSYRYRSGFFNYIIRNLNIII